MLNVGILSVGVGNVFSIQRALWRAGTRPVAISTPHDIHASDAVVLPGVGTFRSGIAGIDSRGLREPLVDALVAGKPCLAICLGFQLLFEGSEEAPSGPHRDGLALLRGTVTAFRGVNEKVPNIGWRQVNPSPSRPRDHVGKVLSGGSFYFAHSYYASSSPFEVLTTDYDSTPFVAGIEKNRLIGVQFHPEKSGPAGLHIVQRFLKLTESVSRSI